MKRYSLIALVLMVTASSFVYAAPTIRIQEIDHTRMNRMIFSEDEARFDTWLPEKDNKLKLLVTVTEPPSTGKIEFDFPEVSNWRGYCMNADDGYGTKQDLCVYEEDQDKYQDRHNPHNPDGYKAYATVADALNGNMLPITTYRVEGGTRHGFIPQKLRWHTHSDGRTIAGVSWVSRTYLPPDTFTIIITIRSEDYGAFGKLRAKLFKPKLIGWRLLATSTPFKIPKDTNHNNIADVWEVAGNGWHSKTKAKTDDEAGPVDNPHTGDGLVAYEEYRGFMVSGTSTGGATGSAPDNLNMLLPNPRHKRLLLNRKDVFVHSAFDFTFYQNLQQEDRVKLGPAVTDAGEPKSGFPSIFKVWFISGNEMQGRVVNFNPCISELGKVYWKVDVKAIYVEHDKTTAANPPDDIALGTADTSADYSADHTHIIDLRKPNENVTHTHGGVPHDLKNTTPAKEMGRTIVYGLRIRNEANREANMYGAHTQQELYEKTLRTTVSHEFAHHLGLADHDVSDIVKQLSGSNPPAPAPQINFNHNNQQWSEYDYEYKHMGLCSMKIG